MAKKHKHPEHENLERWLVSYADFITLLFATFVVLYALAQVDATDFAKLEDSLKHAFSQNSLFEGQENVLSGSDSIFDQQQANSFIPSLMVEYISPKYEEDSFKEIAEDIKELTEIGELEGISAKMTEKGLLLTFDDKYLFAAGSAHLANDARRLLDKVGVLICKKFILHSMLIEGHTDSYAMSNAKFPSNWELSSARACSVVRYLIERFQFASSLFTAVGYADTRPLETAISPKDPVNRRVEILILKNKYKNQFGTRNDVALKLTKAQQDEIQKRRAEIIKTVEGDSMSLAAKKLLEENKKRIEKQKSQKLSRKNMELYINLEDTTLNKSTYMPEIKKQVIRLNTAIPEDEDFGL
ncbi:OmpA family protein [bacterium]|nr:OmpA family protein [bacterium]